MKDIIYKVSVMVTHTAAAGRSSALLGTGVWGQRERERELLGYYWVYFKDGRSCCAP